jgi:O-antigen/teichoic acid export membrane protein
VDSENESTLVDAHMRSPAPKDPSERGRAGTGGLLEPLAPLATVSVDSASRHDLEESRFGKSDQAVAVGQRDRASAHATQPRVQRGAADSLSAADRLPADSLAPPSPALAEHHRLETEQTSVNARHAAMVHGLRWTIIGRPAAEAINLIAAVALARLIAPAEFGHFAVAMVVLALANVPTQAVGYSLVQRDNLERDHLRTGLTLTALIGLGICAVTFVASYTVVAPVFGGQTAGLVRLMIPACFINSVNTVPLAMISRRLEFRRLSLIDITIAIFASVSAVALAADGLSAAAIVLGTTAGSIAGLVLICCWAPPPWPNFHLSAARDLLRFGIPAASGALSLACFSNCDYVILGARIGALQTGFYFRAYTLSVQYQTKVTNVLTSVGFPVLSRASGAEEVDALRERMVHTIALLLFPLLTILVIIAPQFVTWFYGPAWGPSVLPVQLLTLGGAAMCIAGTVSVAMLALGRANAMMHWGWGHFITYAAAVFLLARFGIGAVAAGAAIVHTVFLVAAYVLMLRGSLRRAMHTMFRDLQPAIGSCIGLAAAAIPLSFCLSGLQVSALPYMLAVSVAGGAGYLFTLRVCFPTALQGLLRLAHRVLPARTHCLISRFLPRPHMQSVL